MSHKSKYSDWSDSQLNIFEARLESEWLDEEQSMLRQTRRSPAAYAMGIRPPAFVKQRAIEDDLKEIRKEKEKRRKKNARLDQKPDIQGQAPAQLDRNALREEVFGKVCVELKDFYESVKQLMKGGIWEWEDAAMHVVEKGQRWTYVTSRDIKGKLSKVNKTPRDVIGPVLQSIMRREGFPAGNQQDLAKEYVQVRKGLKKDSNLVQS
jgi:hypothetical protein